MTESTREKILQLISQRPMITVDEISRSLYLTKPDIQYHLKKLISENLVKGIDQPGPDRKKRGRPEKKYVITSETRPNNITNMAIALIQLLLLNEEGTAVEDAFKDIAAFMFPMNEDISYSLPLKLNQMIDDLNANGYQANWEAHPDGPRVVFRNCPYYALHMEHKEICLLDRQVINNYCGLNVNQIENFSDQYRCVFLLV